MDGGGGAGGAYPARKDSSDGNSRKTGMEDGGFSGFCAFTWRPE